MNKINKRKIVVAINLFELKRPDIQIETIRLVSFNSNHFIINNQYNVYIDSNSVELIKEDPEY
jgi:hypothetical protein